MSICFCCHYRVCVDELLVGLFLSRYKKCGCPVVLVFIGLNLSLLPFWLSMLYNFLKSRLYDKFSFWSQIYREKLDQYFSRWQKTETLWPSIFVSWMYIVCVHNTASIRVFSVFMFVCLVGPFCRIKHVTCVNVNILYCMCINVWGFVVVTSRCLCILMCKWLRVFVLEFACLSSMTVLFVSQLYSSRYHKHDCSV